MTIDIRSKVRCTAGEVISGSFSDTYPQQTGLIFTRGSVIVKGTVRLGVGEAVRIGYTSGNNVGIINRNLYCLGCSPDPLRNITTIQLGCGFTLAEKAEAQPSDPYIYSEEEFGDVPCDVYNVSTLGLTAGFIAKQILERIDMSANAQILKNYFYIDKFELSGSLLSLFGNLCLSESCIAYAESRSSAKILPIFGPKPGVLLVDEDIIDISPLTGGEIPGGWVVRYSYKTLTEPDVIDFDKRAKVNWDYEEVFGAKQEVSISYVEENEDGETEDVVVIREFTPYSITLTTYDKWDRAVQRLTYEESALAEVNNRYATDAYRYFGESINSNIESAVPRASLTKWSYRIPCDGATSGIKFEPGFTRDKVKGYKGGISGNKENKTALECVKDKEPPEGYEDVLEEFTTSWITEVELAGTLNVDSYTYNPFPDEDILWTISLDTTRAEIIDSAVFVNFYKSRSSGITQTKTAQQIIYSKTTTGQQDIATYVKNVSQRDEPFNQITSWITGALAMARALRSNGIESRIRTEREFGLQRRPTQAQRNADMIVKATNGAAPTVEAKWESSGGQAGYTFSLPYADDDRIVWDPSPAPDGTFSISKKSEAPGFAKLFGNTQMGLIFGMKYGLSIQFHPDNAPRTPLDRVFVQAKGFYGYYFHAGLTYTFDANGIVASCDLLFIGAGS